MFNLIAGSLKPTAGQIFAGSADVTREAPERRITHGIGRTFQIPRPFAEMTVLENVLTGAQVQAGENILANFVSPGKVAREERAAMERKSVTTSGTSSGRACRATQPVTPWPSLRAKSPVSVGRPWWVEISR